MAFPFFNDKNKLKTLEVLFLFLSLRSRKYLSFITLFSIKCDKVKQENCIGY